jgi:hypothetical protein
LEEKITKAQQADTDKSLQPLYNQLTNKITEAVMANSFDRLNRISAQSSTGLTGSKELQDKISKQVADATNTLINRGFQMSQAQFNRAMAQGNLAVRNELLNLRKDNLTKTDIKTKTIPIGSVQALSELKTSTKLLDEIVNKIDTGKVGPVQGVNRFNPYDTDVQAFNQLIASTKQVIGKSLEGGVLRLEDEKKYEKIIPKITDTKSTLIAKANNLRSMIETKHNDMLTEFENSGYKINKLQPIQSKYYSSKTDKQGSQTKSTEKKDGDHVIMVKGVKKLITNDQYNRLKAAGRI